MQERDTDSGGDDGGRRDRPAWQPPQQALQARVWQAPGDEQPATILLRHPAAPFIADVDVDDEVGVQRAAHAYLGAARRLARLPIPPWWIAACDPDREPNPEFGWLPAYQEAGEARPIASRLVESGPGRANRALVLLAAERNGDLVLGSEFGIRIVVQAMPPRNGPSGIRITGLAASLPFAEFDSDGRNDTSLDFPRGFAGFRGFLDGLIPTLAVRLGLREESIFFRGIRLGRKGESFRRLELRGRGLANTAGVTPQPFEFLVETTLSLDATKTTELAYRKIPLTACMAAQARVLRCDPASLGGEAYWRDRRPTRPDAALDTNRTPASIDTPLQIAGRLDVIQSRFVLGDDPANGVKAVASQPAGPPVRSNDFTAVGTFHTLRELFRHFDLYGISLDDYFQHASLPLKAHYRSAVRPGPGGDGRTVNGRVLPEGWPVTANVAPTSSDRPLLNIHLALGNLNTRARKPWDGVKRSPAEPLGFAADPRWVWHEIGHVLLMAALGELEFRFAHSMGDALAAIIADPRSRLSRDPTLRGNTFPWVFVPRRHDRCVLHGWGWAGPLGRALREVPDSERLRRKGYTTEQILSTSLFRVYRGLGGDTVDAGTPDPDRHARRRASDYAVYLIVEALRLLGDPRVVPASRSELFADALTQADTMTETCPTRDLDDHSTQRIGGCAHKAIAWAFEAQGMAFGSDAAPPDGPAPPPPIDIYIEDGRDTNEVFPDATVAHGPGSYVPVSLDWAGAAAIPPGADPAWFARPDAMRPVGGAIDVTVGNRGSDPATAVHVRLWSIPWPDGEPPPPWDGTQWIRSATSVVQDVPAAGSITFAGLALPAAPGRYLILAEAGCAADPANIDPATALAPTRHPTPLHELVPLDNNLGLRALVVP